VLREKLIVTHLVEKFPAFYVIRMFVTLFRSAHQWGVVDCFVISWVFTARSG